jgi:3-methyladenine DNA glycosylase AlkC
MATPKRKGASKVADVPADILAQLNAGEIESATLSESLAMDFSVLLCHVLPSLEDEKDKIDPKAGVTKRMNTVADIIYARYGMEPLSMLAEHSSDLVRGWGAYLVAKNVQLTLKEAIDAMIPFAADSHFGVREWCWLALRPAIVAEPEEAIRYLTPLSSSDDENLRRFASEATRPRGVWATHIKQLKTEPELGLPIIEPLQADPSRYVQDSVANWLNDAWKSSPEWVETLCTQWDKHNNSDATGYIIKRALRNRK